MLSDALLWLILAVVVIILFFVVVLYVKVVKAEQKIAELEAKAEPIINSVKTAICNFDPSLPFCTP